MSDIQYVPQRNGHDCGIAVLAMITGHQYETVLNAIDGPISGHGINQNDAEEYLLSNGFAWQTIYQKHIIHGHLKDRGEWPVKPWAPLHIAQVKATQDWHFIVVGITGTVFDPFDATRKSLSDPAYRQVAWIMGIWPIAELRERADKAEAERDEIKQVLISARVSASVLLQSQEVCVRAHHGHRDEPGWLADCRRDIEALSRAALNKEQG